MLVMIEGALITGGICVSYWLDYGFYYLDPSAIIWRFPIAFQIVFALIILAFVLELPESPGWLILKGKEDEALNVLAALGGLSTDGPYIHNEFTEIEDTVLIEAEALKTYSPWMRIAIFTGWRRSHMSSKYSSRFQEPISQRTCCYHISE
jgi:hypothetical protein